LSNQPSVDTLSRILSITALSVSAIGAGVLVRREWLDRSDIKAGFLLHGEDDQLYEYELEVVNLGRRPMGLAGIWAKYPDGDDGLHGLDFPVVHPDGGYYRSESYRPDWLRHPETGDMPVEVAVQDRRGKRYPIKGAERLLEEIS